jgi:mannosyl-3-phosphoglycerate synthase
MNRLLNSLTNTGKQDVIQTANAGEHAMTVDLALQLHFASGYAVEPFQLVDAWERLAAQDRAVQILQIETRNPHFHDCGKGDGHIKRMQAGGLSTIYHSPLTSQNLKAELKQFCKENLAEVVGVDGAPEKSNVYPPLRTMDFDVFREGMEARAGVVAAGGVVGSR